MIWATMGGVTVGLTLLGMQLVRWVKVLPKVLRKPRALALEVLPFASGWAYGVLGVLSVMGLIGWAFDTLLWASNWLGDAALVIGVGGDAGVSSRGTYLPLVPQGSGLVLILTGCFLTACKVLDADAAGELKRGAWCGACLGTSAGVAGLAAVPLAQAVNAAGIWLYGMVNAA